MDKAKMSKAELAAERRKEMMEKQRRMQERAAELQAQGVQWATFKAMQEFYATEVADAIETLSDPYKTVVKLFLMEGYDHQEIAEIMQISESASRTNLFRGKKRLKEQLKHLRYGTGY